MIDKNGFRLNVGIILANKDGQLFWGKRIGNKNAWQFPQGGVTSYETLKETMYRELTEELGLTENDVEIIATTKDWLYYKLPVHLRRKLQKPLCIGQRQKWFLLRLIGDDDRINLAYADKPEFTQWLWVDYWRPLREVVYFKHTIYKTVLEEFAPHLQQPPYAVFISTEPTPKLPLAAHTHR